MTETALFGAGCFWGVEARFAQMPGVLETAVGYAGGKNENPTYKQVCTDTTGHAEVVQVVFDPEKVSYQTLVETFFALHNPTQLNYQGPDYGTQYRSAIFFHSPEQERIARETIRRLSATGGYRGAPRPIVTEVTLAAPFWRAEEYHQKYLAKRGLETCHI